MIHRTDPPAGGERPTLARTLPLWFCTTCDYTGEADGPDLSKFTG